MICLWRVNAEWDSKPHSVDVVVCTVCQSESHESAECPTHKQFANELNRTKDISPGAHIGGAHIGKPGRISPSDENFNASRNTDVPVRCHGRHGGWRAV